MGTLPLSSRVHAFSQEEGSILTPECPERAGSDRTYEQKER